jgi:hypothetical protein
MPWRNAPRRRVATVRVMWQDDHPRVKAGKNLAPLLAVGLILAGVRMRRGRKVNHSHTVMSAVSLKDPQDPALASKHRLLSRIEESFHGGYLTLMSIIQGVAFGFLVQQWPAQKDPFEPHQWILFFITAGFIALAWQEYLIGASMFAWVPTVIDALVPFGLGLVEAIVAASIRLPLSRFVAACALIVIGGFAAYVNYYVQAQEGLGDSTRNAAIFRPLHKSGLAILFLSAPYYSVLWIWTVRWPTTDEGRMAIALLCSVPLVAMFARIPLCWNKAVSRLRVSVGS